MNPSARGIPCVMPTALKGIDRGGYGGFATFKESSTMPLIGAHMSTSGGYYRAVDAAAEFKMDCVQIFTKSNTQWRAKETIDADVDQFRAALERTGVRKPCAHDSYLINLGSPNLELWQKSLDAFVVELERAGALNLAGLVMHPGSACGDSEEAALGRIVTALDRALERTSGLSTQIWIETTAGQGSSLGHRFEHLAAIIEGLQSGERVGVCIDTCHIFAAGYAISQSADYAATMAEFDRVVGLDRVRAFHLNDSKRELGSRVDRHAHIGEGHLGREAFRNVLCDPRFAELPMYLETPKGVVEGKHHDTRNMAALRKLAAASRSMARQPIPVKSAASRTVKVKFTAKAPVKAAAGKRASARRSPKSAR